MFALYNPANPDDLVRDIASGEVVTTDAASPTLADAPAGTPQGCYWLQIHDEADTSGILAFDDRNHQYGEPEIMLVPPGKAVRVVPVNRKA
jgi:hypothetical protein